jgi:CRISPR-associated endoribonuclease Cas6
MSLRGKAEAISLLFLTPTRILYNAHLTLDLEFHIFIRNLLRRLSLISYFHCNVDPSGWDFRAIIEKAKTITTITRDLRWYDWQRYSGRQESRIKMGGFIGNITFGGDTNPFMPLIRAGEILHVGKGTAFGLGKYRLT